jgi:putative transposase
MVNCKITYRLYPNSTESAALEATLGLHCRVYNTLLEEHRRRYEVKLPTYSFRLMCRDLTIWRDRIVSLEQLNAQSLQVTAKRASLAFKSFFRRVKSGETPGYPRFKSADRFSGWGYKTHGDGWRLIETDQDQCRKNKPRTHHLCLSGIGIVRVRGKGRFAGVPKTCEITRSRGKWYASISFNVPFDQVARTSGTETAAFDWGVKHLLTIATKDGGIETIDNPKHLKKQIASLGDLQRTVSKEELKAKASIGLSESDPIPVGVKLPKTKKMIRLYKLVAAIHHKIANQRTDFHHKLSAMLVKRFSCLATEELDIVPMVEKPEPIPSSDGSGFEPNGASRKATLNRNILDTAPSTLLKMIATKAEEAASQFIQADTRKLKPTQRCHQCGTLVPKELHDRWHTCPACYCHCDRDENAARTILRWFLEGNYWLTKPSWAGTVQPYTTGTEETPSIALA